MQRQVIRFIAQHGQWALATETEGESNLAGWRIFRVTQDISGQLQAESVRKFTEVDQATACWFWLRTSDRTKDEIIEREF